MVAANREEEVVNYGDVGYVFNKFWWSLHMVVTAWFGGGDGVMEVIMEEVERRWVGNMVERPSIGGRKTKENKRKRREKKKRSHGSKTLYFFLRR